MAGAARMVFVVGLAWASAISADVSAEGSPGSLEQIKTAALDVAVDAADARQGLDWPDRGGIEIYVSLDAPGLRLVSAVATIDDAPVRREGFSALEDQAFAGGGWYRLVQIDRSAKHQIHIDAVLAANGSQGTPVQLAADLALEPQAPDTALVAMIDSRLIAAPKLRLVVLHPTEEKAGLLARLWSGVPVVGGAGDRYLPGSEDDPQMRRARFLSASQEYLDAAAVIRRRQAGEPGCLDSYCQAALAQALLDYGLPVQAVALEPRWRKADADQVHELRRHLADRYYRRGDYDAADQILGNQPRRREEAPLLAWQDLKYRLLMAQGHIGDAITMLRAMEPQASFEGYARYYNLGVALVASGNVSQGLTILDRIGSIVADSLRMVALRDRANLAAGIYFMTEGQGATAIPLLEKVHERGLDTGRAMLALGWAWLAPAGTQQARALIGDERTVGVPPESATSPQAYKGDQNLYQRFHLDPFERAPSAIDRQAKLRRAIAVWTELVDHQAADAVLPEALLALGGKLEEAGDGRQAAHRYEQTVAALEQSQALITQARAYVAGDQAEADLYAPEPGLGFDREPHNLPRSPFASYLDDTLAGWPFREALADYRDARVLTVVLGRLAQEVQEAQAAHCGGAGGAGCEALGRDVEAIATLQARLVQAAAAWRGPLLRPLQNELDARGRWSGKLMENARFALARVYDREQSK
jgi:hypothetical protein